MPRPRGRQPGKYGDDLPGLLVKHSNREEHFEDGARTGRFAPAGWFIFVRQWRGNSIVWQSILELRFVREKDAQLAARALRGAGLDSAKRMKAAGAPVVIRTAFEALEW